MSIAENQQIISCLLRYGVGNAMIAILQRQRINDEDLQTMDRDDIEHLFKNEYGFTFSDRKRFWRAIQKLQLIPKRTTKDDVIYVELEDETSDICEITDDESSNYNSIQPSLSLSSSITHNYVHTNSQEKNQVEETNSYDDAEDGLLATTSLPAYNRFSRAKPSSDRRFHYPIDLPIFSSKVMQALETKDIDSEWQTLLDEITQWVLTLRLTQLQKHEHQAIGQSIYTKYPVIAKDGFRPWSYFCKCLTQNLRKERKRRGLPYLRKDKK